MESWTKSGILGFQGAVLDTIPSLNCGRVGNYQQQLDSTCHGINGINLKFGLANTPNKPTPQVLVVWWRQKGALGKSKMGTASEPPQLCSSRDTP